MSKSSVRLLKAAAEAATLQKHIITARMVQNRLDKVQANEPLTADEIAQGVRLSHEEYVDLVRRVVEAARLQSSPE